MKARSQTEIQNDIKKEIQKRMDLYKKYDQGKYFVVDEINKCTSRICNLKLELNKANQKKWGIASNKRFMQV